jgi:hypothetical protein
MRKFLSSFLVLCFLLFATLAFAADVVQTGNSFDSVSRDMRIATFTITADGSGDVAIFTFLDPQKIYGWNLLAVEMYSADDDAFATTITTALGSTLFTHTTTAATSGELENATDRWPIYSIPKIDVVGLTATKVATVIVTFQR